MKMKVHDKSIKLGFNQKLIFVFFITITSVLYKVHAQTHKKECDIPLNAVVSSSGNLSNDGKGTYYTGKDWVAIWLNPSRWTDQSFHICMNWPFDYYHTCDSANTPVATGIRDSRTLVHHITSPILKGNGKALGDFTGPGGGNHLALSRPLTSTVKGFTDMAIGSSLSPRLAEVRFSNTNGSEYYSVIFGDSSLFHQPNINGVGSTRPIVSRTSESTWTISFPSGTIGRLWHLAAKIPTSELYYYEGSIEITIQ
jgi:hypothetical protein